MCTRQKRKRNQSPGTEVLQQKKNEKTNENKNVPNAISGIT